MKDMDDIFSNFYSKYVEKIHSFLNSSDNILYINGYSGSGKSTVLKEAIKTYKNDILTFPVLCFKGIEINDFLLSFYDAFREHTIKGKISLVKNPEEGFLDKVSFYFKNLNFQAVVIIDNFEIVESDTSISDFLFHISKFDNVKVVLISKNPASKIMENPIMEVRNLVFDKIKQDEFERVMQKYFPELDDEYINKFYNSCQGYEIYLKMTLTYLQSANASIKKLLDEQEIRDIEFSDFIIEKQISLIPKNYYDILENFAYINHSVPIQLFENYSLGDEKQLPYLISKFAVSEFFGTYYIKSYLRKYFFDIKTVQDKITICTKLKSIYEIELEKSLKDRILRLSRESIRKQIANIDNIMPKVKKINVNPAFNYMAQSINSNPKWFVTDINKKTSALDELRKKRDERLNAKENNDNEKTLNDGNKTEIDELLSKVLEFEQNHDYESVSQILSDALKKELDFEDKVKVYSKLIQNFTKLGDNSSALLYLREICEIAQNENNQEIYSRFRIIIGRIYKKMYAFERAKNCFLEVIKKSDLISCKTQANARVSLGEIYELENNFNKALEEYKNAYSIILVNEGDNNKSLPEISYKIASILDENEIYEEALEFYKNTVKYSETSGNNKFLFKANLSLGVIQSYFNDTEGAINSFKIAYELSNTSDNVLDKYYAARNLAAIYSNIDSDITYTYLNDALECARKSGYDFETAISLLELGDYYYNLKQNEQALIYYFQAKNILGSNTSKENIERIDSRINDMKVKLGNYIFSGMKALYEQN